MPAGSKRAVAEITRIATLPGSSIERARALLEPLGRLMPFDAACINLLDPERRILPPLIHHGYDARVQRFMGSPALVDDVERVGMDRRRAPMRVKDSPLPPEELPSWADYLHPAGFREGMAIPLTTPDGRYLGLLNVNTATRTPVSDPVRDLLAGLAPLIAAAVDPMRTLTALAGTVADAVAGAALTRAGNTEPLPGLPADPLLAPGAAVPLLARTMLKRGQLHARFLAPCDDSDPAPLAQVTLLLCPPQPPGHLNALLLLSPPPDLRGLTRRELQVLGLLAEGHNNAAIAAALTMSVRTAISHLEHIMVKLDAGSRTMAAVRAVRQGLYLPASLTATGGHR